MAHSTPGQSPRRFDRLVTALGILLIAVVVLAGLWIVERAERDRFESDQRAQILSQLSQIRVRLESELLSELLLARSLVVQVSIQPDISMNRFTSVVRSFMAESKHTRNIGLAIGTTLTYVYPEKENEAAIGLDYRDHAGQWPAVKRAIESGKTVVAGPLDLVQGGSAIIARSPVFTTPRGGAPGSGPYFGLISIVINTPSLFAEAGLTSGTLPFRVAMRGIDGQGALGSPFFGEEEVFSSAPVLLEVALPDGRWQLAAVPKEGWNAVPPSLNTYRMIALVVVLVLAGLWVAQRMELAQRRRAEASLKESEANLTSLVESTDDFIWFVDRDLRLVHWNEALQGHFKANVGVNLKVGLLPEDILPTEKANLWRSLFSRTLLGERIELEDEVTGGRQYSMTLNPIVRSQNIIGVSVFGKDITARKIAEAQREDVERLVRHELRSPLTSLIAMCRFFQDAENLDSEQKRVVEASSLSAERMLKLIDRYLDLYLMETGAYEVALVHVELLEVVSNIASELAIRLQSDKVRLEIYSDHGPIGPGERFLVLGEESLCHILVSNLVRNAVDASPEGSGVRVTLSDEGGSHLTVHNPGVVPEDVRDRFFEKYATSGKKGGTGLGTYIAKRIVETLGGTIEMTTSEERGTTVTVRFKS